MRTAMASSNRASDRISIGLIALVAALVLVGGTLIAYEALSSLKAERASIILTAAKMKGRIQQAKADLENTAPEEIKKLTRDFLPGSQTAIIQAELQNRLRSLFEANNVILTSHNALPPKAVDGTTYIGLRVIARGQLPDIQKFLHSVEMSTPILFVNRAQMRVDVWQNTTEATPSILCEFDIFGVKLPPGPLAQSGSSSDVPDMAGLESTGTGGVLLTGPVSRPSRSRL